MVWFLNCILVRRFRVSCLFGLFSGFLDNIIVRERIFLLKKKKVKYYCLLYFVFIL